MKKTEVINAIIIRADKHKEFDLRLVIFGDQGLRTVYAIGALRPNAKLKGALQLFNLCELTITGVRVTGAVVLQNGADISRDINRYYLACSICETLHRLSRYSDEHTTPDVFALASASLGLLATGEISYSEVFIHFYHNLLLALGYDVEEGRVNATSIKNAYIIQLDFQIPFASNLSKA